mmetsp:Transcript_40351/g.128227  ORF Transcript_40351/g.128227 Transcript_40351/m.128227 type:complete len:347 (+) Transcript_40351:87-1127(+)
MVRCTVCFCFLALHPLACVTLVRVGLLPCCSFRYEREVVNCSLAEVPSVPSLDEGNLGMVHVAYASDSANFAGVLASMTSLSRHLREAGRCRIHLIVSGADMERAAQMVECFRQNLSFSRVVPSVVLHRLIPVNISGLGTTYRRHLLKQQTFARLHLHEYLPQTVSRVIWLDHDTIVKSDLRQLYQMRMEHAIAAAWDHGHGDTRVGSRMRSYLPHLSPSASKAIPDLDARVFGTGVMVMDLDSWRSGGLARGVEQWVAALDGVEGEQLAMNVFFRDRFDVLDWRWNVMGLGWIRYRLPEHCIEQAHILHWSGPNRQKPWYQSWHRIRTHDDLFEPYDPRQRCDMS